MFALVAGGVLTYSMYQSRKATEAVIYQRNANGDLTTDGEAQTVYLENNGQTVNPYENVDTWQYYQDIKAEWREDEDGTVWFRDKHYRRNSYVKAILVLGVDRKGDMLHDVNDGKVGAGQSDFIALVAQDTARSHIKVMMIPRDTVTELDILDENGNITGTEIKNVTLAWAYGDGGDRSAQNAVKAVSGMLCGMNIDHYAASNMTLLGEINDAVGGVTVTIPSDELAKKYPEWTMGSQVTLHGDEAEQFLRYRDLEMDASPVYRMGQHKAYMLGFYDAVRNASRSNSNIVTDLYELVQDNLVTDMDKAEILKLGMDAVTTDSLTGDDILTVPCIYIHPDENWKFDREFVDYQSAIPVILDMFYREI